MYHLNCLCGLVDYDNGTLDVSERVVACAAECTADNLSSFEDFFAEVDLGRIDLPANVDQHCEIILTIPGLLGALEARQLLVLLVSLL